MKKIKLSALAIAVVLSATGIYGTTKKGNQVFNAAPSQAVSGSSAVLTQANEPSLDCENGSSQLNICVLVTTSDAPAYSVTDQIPREHIQTITRSYNP
jgi:hypothetical protein